MKKLLYEFSPTTLNSRPATAEAARLRLEEGNRRFVELCEAFAAPGDPDDAPIHRTLTTAELGLADDPCQAPKQAPFAAVLGCADARVPIELLFSHMANEIFVLRVAGNLLTAENLGSLHYAVEHLHSVRLLVVLGHTTCGAVTSAAGAYLSPSSYLELTGNPPLRTLLDYLMSPVRHAAEALSHTYENVADLPGYPAALVELAAALNAAQISAGIQRAFQSQIGERLGVAFGVYNLCSRQVGLPAAHSDAFDWQPGLFTPPADEAGFSDLARRLATSEYIYSTLKSIERTAP